VRLTAAVSTLAFLAGLATGQPGSQWTVHLQSAGPVRIGMSLPELRDVLRDMNARLEGNDTDLVGQCAYLVSSRVPEDLGIMLLNGHVARFDVYKPGIRSWKGAAVGDTEARVKQLFPSATVEPHLYDPESGHYITFVGTSTDANYAILFETDGAKVTSFRAGTLEGIALVEGCS